MRAPELALAALVSLGLAVIWAWPISRSLGDTVTDLGDPLHLAWVLAWDAHQFVRKPWDLFDSNSFFPHRNSLAFSDHLLPQAMLFAPAFWLTQNAVLASNLLRLALLAGNAVGLFTLLRWAGLRAGAAALGGVAYAFNGFSRDNLALVHALSVAWWPLAMLLLLRFAETARPRFAAAAAGACVLQGLSYSYYLIYSTLLVPCWLVLSFFFVRRWPTRPEIVALGVSALVAGGLVALVVSPYLDIVPGLPVSRPSSDPPRWLSYLDPGPGHRLWGRGHDGGSFLGYFAVAPAVVGGAGALFRAVGERPRRIGVLAVAAGLLGLALERGANVGLGELQLAGRVFPLILLAVAVWLAVGIDLLVRRLPRRGHATLIAALAVLLPLEHWGGPRPAVLVPVGENVPAVYRWLASGEPDPIVELPHFGNSGKRLFAAYLYFSTYHWRPIPLGRTSLVPPGHDFVAWLAEEFPSERSIAVLGRLGIKQVVVHPLGWEPEVRAERVRRLDAQPLLALERVFADPPRPQFEVLRLGYERVYRIRPTTLEKPCTEDEELPRDQWSMRSSEDSPGRFARDGDPATAWTTVEPQGPRSWLRVRLGSPTEIAVISVQLPPADFPRDLLLDVKETEEAPWDAIAWRDDAAARWEALEALIHRPREAFLRLRFPSQVVSSFRLRVGYPGANGSLPRWALPELRAYRVCR